MIWSFQDKDYNNSKEKVEHQTELPAAPLIVSLSRETFQGEWWHSALKNL